MNMMSAGDAARARLNEERRDGLSAARGILLAMMISLLVFVLLVGAIGITP